MTDDQRTTSCAWCSTSVPDGEGETWETGQAIRHRTGPVGPLSRRITLRWPAGSWTACVRCAPLVRARDFAGLATRDVIAAMTRQDETAEVLPHAELVALYRAVDAALVR